MGMAASHRGRLRAIRAYKSTLAGGFKHFLFSPLFGEMIQFDMIVATTVCMSPVGSVVLFRLIVWCHWYGGAVPEVQGLATPTR